MSRQRARDPELDTCLHVLGVAGSVIPPLQLRLARSRCADAIAGRVRPGNAVALAIRAWLRIRRRILVRYLQLDSVDIGASRRSEPGSGMASVPAILPR